MKRFIVLNPDVGNKTFLASSLEAAMQNLGLAGATAITEDGLSVCLAPLTTQIPDATLNKSECIELNDDGLYAIEIDGVVVPRAFSPEMLLTEFVKGNPTNIVMKECAGSRWTVQYTLISTGEVVSIDTGPTVSSATIDSDIDFNAQWTDEVYDLYNARVLDRRDLVINKTVTSIEDGTFRDWTNLGTVNLRGGGAVGGTAFYGLNLSSVIIGPGVTSIGNYAFGNNPHGAGVSLVFEEGVVDIGDNAFDSWVYGETIHLPQSIRTLGQSAFGNWVRVTDIDLGGLINIGDPNNVFSAVQPFMGVASESQELTLNMGTSLKHICNEGLSGIFNGTTLITSPALEYIGNFALGWWGKNRGAIDSRINGTTGAEEGYFSTGAQGNWGVVLPSTILHIGDYAFIESYFSEVTIVGNANTVVGEYAFQKCTAESLTIGQLSTIGNYAFQQMHMLNNLDIQTGINDMTGYAAFQLATNLESVHVPGGCLTVSGGPFNACPNLATVTMGEGIEQIGSPTTTDGLFASSVGDLTELVYPNSVLRFYGDQWGSQENLKKVYLGSNLEVMNLSSISSATRELYIASPYNPAFTPINQFTPWFAVYVTDVENWVNAASAGNKPIFGQFVAPPTASMPTLQPLAAIDVGAEWSIQYLNLETGNIEYQYFADGIIPAGWAEGEMRYIDDLIVNGDVTTVSKDALIYESIKRVSVLDGVVNIGPTAIGIQRMKEVQLPTSVKRLGNTFIVPVSLETVEMPLTGYLSVDATAFGGWPAGIDHPTESVFPDAPVYIGNDGTTVTGTAEPDSEVWIRRTAPTENLVIGNADNSGAFVIELNDWTIASGDTIEITAYDIVKNSAKTTVTV